MGDAVCDFGLGEPKNTLSMIQFSSCFFGFILGFGWMVRKLYALYQQ
jgi:hypothetical protein